MGWKDFLTAKGCSILQLIMTPLSLGRIQLLTRWVPPKGKGRQDNLWSRWLLWLPDHLRGCFHSCWFCLCSLFRGGFSSMRRGWGVGRVTDGTFGKKTSGCEGPKCDPSTLGSRLQESWGSSAVGHTHSALPRTTCAFHAKVTHNVPAFRRTAPLAEPVWRRHGITEHDTLSLWNNRL